MNDSMIHRGPDDGGTEQFDAGGGWTVGLGHRRLSIQDLSREGHEPFHSVKDDVVVSYNGEVYNFRELREELSDYPYRSTTDTEVIVAAYLKWGIDCIRRLNGMFALAIFDRRVNELYLVRDRIGKKPLYYAKVSADGAEKDGTDGILFASELKPILLAPGFRKEINRRVLSRYLFQQCIDAPDTVFEHVHKLEPGAVLRFRIGDKVPTAGTSAETELFGPADLSKTPDDRTGAELPTSFVDSRWTVRKYWNLAKVYHEKAADPVTDYADAKAQLKDLLRTATKERLIADVPFGCFLSGGYDSSLVSAIAQEQLGSEPLKTFCIGFNEPRYNEAPYAKQIADHLGTKHTELTISEAEMLSLVDSIPQYFDEPFADSSQIPMMLVAALARNDVTVALSGDGGDEFFCGYNIYETVKKAQELDKLGAAAHVLGKIPVGGGKTLVSKFPFRVRVVAENRDPETKTQFGAGSYVESAKRMVLQEQGPDGKAAFVPVNYACESRYNVQNWQIRRMLVDMEHYLPADILAKVDRATMKYALEARCPILDTRVMEFSFRIPHEFKYQNGDKKHILKDIAYDYIPRELLDRPKTGFGVPLDKWLRGPLREKLAAYGDPAFLKAQDLFDADYTAQFIRHYLETGDGGPATGRNYSKLSWSFYVFQAWYERYCTEGSCD